MTIRPALADKRVLVLGYGSIGRAIAARLTPFEVQVTAVASSARDGDDLVPSVHAVAQLPSLLPQHDVVIVIVPLSPATTRLVDADFLAAMPDGALLVNVARGGVVDTDALVREAASGRLLAALDVTDPEPLPPGHPLWSTPGVLITPHVGGASSAFRPRAVRLVRDQLKAYAAASRCATSSRSADSRRAPRGRDTRVLSEQDCPQRVGPASHCPQSARVGCVPRLGLLSKTVALQRFPSRCSEAGLSVVALSVVCMEGTPAQELSLAEHREVIAAARSSCPCWGRSCGRRPLVAGRTGCPVCWARWTPSAWPATRVGSPSCGRRWTGVRPPAGRRR